MFLSCRSGAYYAVGCLMTNVVADQVARVIGVTAQHPSCAGCMAAVVLGSSWRFVGDETFKN
jgi:hypothetical protein